METPEALSWQTFTFGTWNVCGLTKKITDVVAEIERENEDIVVLTETKLRGVGKEELGNYFHVFSGVTYKGGFPSAGVSILIKKEFCRNFEWEVVDERIIWVKLNICDSEVIVIGVYWVDDCRSTVVKDLFQRKLRKVIDNVEDNCELIILGDFNAWVGKAVNDTCVGEFGVDQLNNNGIRLKNVCTKFNLKIQNTFFNHRDIHKYTWYGSGSKKSLIDYCITRQESKLDVQDVIACRWLECGTDHMFLEATISFPFVPKRQPCLSETMTEMPKYKTYLLFSKSLRASYKEYLESLINPSINRTTDEMYQHLKESIHTAARNTLGFVLQDRFGEFLWDSEIRELREFRMKQTSTTAIPVTYDCTIDPGIKNEIWKGICADVNSRGKIKKSRTVRSILEELLNKPSNKAVTNDINSFKKWFTEERENFIKFPDSTERKFDETDKDPLLPISVTDIEMALDDLEYCNYPAPGALSANLLRYSSTKTKILLRDLIQCIFRGEKIPNEINEMYIYVISNVNNRSKRISESTVQVMHPIMIIMCSLLKKILENKPSVKKASISYEPQLDAIFILRLISQKNATKQKDFVHFVVIDLADSYASVPLVKLFETLHTSQIEGNLLWLIKHMIDGNSATDISGSDHSETFPLNKGLNRTCALASLLYRIYVSEALKAWRKEFGDQGIRIGAHDLSFLYSEDKLTLFAGSKENLESMLVGLKKHFKGLGLRITPQTVNYMGNENLRLGNETILGESAIDYQGSILEYNGGNEKDITRRMLEIKTMIGLLHPIARDELILERNKRRIFNSIVKSALAHGCETWTVTKTVSKQIEAVELRYWKWCCEKFPGKLTSPKIYELMNVNQKVSNVIMLKKAAWYTKLKEKSNDNWTKRIFEWEPEGKRKAARPRAKWVDGVEDFIITMGQNSKHLLKNQRFAKHD